MKECEIYGKILGKRYKVCYEIEKGCESWIKGIILNYNYGNIVLFNEQNETIYHIPYSGVKWILPMKSSTEISFTKEHEQ